MFTQIAHPAVIAHRGASKYAPENTLAAFHLAARQKADAIELDAKLTHDGHVVAIHDSTVDRTTDGTGKVAGLPLAALQALDAGSFFDQAFAGERIPTLDEVFEAVGHTLFVNVELTNYAAPFDALPEKVAGIVARHNMHARVLFSSFNPLALHRIRRLVNAPIGLLTPPGFSGSLSRALAGGLLAPQALHPDFRDVDPELVARTHSKGQRLYPYTIDTLAEMQRLLRWGVDGLITDDPLLAQEAIRGQV